MTDARELRCLIAAGGTTGDVLPAVAAARRRARWRRLRGRPDGLRRLARGHPHGPDGGGRARWPRQPPRGSLRGACVPVVPGRRQGAAEVPRHRPADPGKVAAVAPGREPTALRAAGVGTGAARLRRQPGRPQPERAHGRELRRRRSRRPAPVGSPRLRAAPASRASPRLCPCSVHGRLRCGARRRRPRHRAGRRLGLGDRCGGQAGDPHSVSPRHGRPPGKERGVLPRRGRGDRRGREQSRPGSRSRTLPTGRPRPDDRDERGDAARLAAGRGRQDRGGADRTCGWVRTPLMSSSGSTGQFRRPHEQSSRVLKAAPPSRRLGDRRLWFVGIGGAGLSGYAVLAKAWGAEVAGWDRVETPYLEHVRAAGIPVRIEQEPVGAPEGWECVVSTAFAGQVPGRTRAELLAELVSLQYAVVVAGAHGKPTTAGMIAFCLDRLERDPSFLIGGDVPQLGGNARAGSGWLVAEGDESDRTIEHLRPKIAVVTNVDLDHHSEFASRAEVEELFERWLVEVPEVVRGDELEPADMELAIPGEHNRRNAAVALAALELVGVPAEEARAALADFRGTGRRLERRGGGGGGPGGGGQPPPPAGGVPP